MRLSLFVASAIACCIYASATGASDNPGSAASACSDLDCRTNGLPFVTDAGGITVMVGEAFSVDLKSARVTQWFAGSSI
ncbi:MAG: hypothetical protein ABL996_06150 [Micropepsaceae bacterium]